jgi:hypothetical protein
MRSGQAGKSCSSKNASGYSPKGTTAMGAVTIEVTVGCVYEVQKSLVAGRAEEGGCPGGDDTTVGKIVISIPVLSIVTFVTNAVSM